MEGTRVVKLQRAACLEQGRHRLLVRDRAVRPDDPGRGHGSEVNLRVLRSDERGAGSQWIFSLWYSSVLAETG